jgi:hypothetical protein
MPNSDCACETPVEKFISIDRAKGSTVLSASLFEEETRTGFRNVGLFNPLPLLFKALLQGQKDCVIFSGHLI